ncbi:hypothetical protein F2S72_09025 [Pseudomonas syringae pv. actinidiae]|nr:hypothetical protein [Pseudomonas syringae pv. actinidiae]
MMHKPLSVLKLPIFMNEPLDGNTSQETWDWLKYQGNQLRFDKLAEGDRFLTTESLWTKLNPTQARHHSSKSRGLGSEGNGYDDPVCYFDADDVVAYVPPLT